MLFSFCLRKKRKKIVVARIARPSRRLDASRAAFKARLTTFRLSINALQGLKLIGTKKLRVVEAH